MRQRINENMVWTDSQDYGADEILYTIGTVLFNINNRLMREITILFEVYPQMYLTPAINKPGVENRMEILGGRSLYGSLRLVRTAPIHVGHKGVSISTKIMPDGSDKVFVNVKVKEPLPFVKSISPVPEAWGGDVRIENRVLGEDGMVIKKPKFGTQQSLCQYQLETKVFYTGKLVDVVTNSFSVMPSTLMQEGRRYGKGDRTGGRAEER